MGKYWFKPKRYGYGATPVTWQGWVLTGAVIGVALLASLLVLVPNRADPAAWILWAAIIGIAVAIAWIVSRRKTDGIWRWRWGRQS